MNIYYLLAENTIEERLIDLLAKKAKILEQVLDGASPDSSNMLQELFNSFKIE